MSTTEAACGAWTVSVALIAASLIRRDRLVRHAAQMEHLPPLGQHDAGLASFGLAGLQNALRHRLALEQVGIPPQLVVGENLLRHGLQIVALQRDEARALQGYELLSGDDPIAARDRQIGDHAGDRRAHHP